jgi:hypothetical protein
LHRRSQASSGIRAMLNCCASGNVPRKAAALAAVQCDCSKIGHQRKSLHGCHVVFIPLSH